MKIVKKIKNKLWKIARKTARKSKNIFVQPNKAVILIYHRVYHFENDPQLLAVTPKRFEAQIKHLKENYHVLSLQQLVCHLKKGKVPDNAVVITFDDGYADNLYFAKPILEKYNVPATVFVTAGMLGRNTEYWCDELERIFMENEIYKPLEIQINDKVYSWNITKKEDLTKVYHQLSSVIKDVPSAVREEKMAQLRTWAGICEIGRESHRFLTEAELIKLAEGDLIEIGAHTMTHCVLAVETPEQQQWEITESKKVLENILGKKVESFSYPYGLLTDFSTEAAWKVEAAGFNCGIANEQHGIEFEWDIYKLPRRIVRNWDINLFQEKMHFFFSRKTTVAQGIQNKWQVMILPQKMYQRELLPRVKKYEKKTAGLLLKEFSPYRILHINTLDNKGGAARIAHNLHDYINQSGRHSEMIVDRAVTDQDDTDIIQRDFSEQQRLLWYAQKNMGWLDFFNLATFKIKDMAQFKNSDILHLHNLHGGYFSYFALPELSALKPTVWTLHDMQAITGHCGCSLECEKWLTGCGDCPDLSIYPGIERDTTSFLWETKRKIFEKSDLTIVCPSNWLKNIVEKSILKEKDIRLIHNGIQTDVFKMQEQEKARRYLGLPRDKKILLFCAEGGTGNFLKGGNYLVQAYEALKHRADLFFVTIGGNKDDTKENWLNIDYIHDTWRLAQYYAASDLFVYPSLAESFGLVVGEAMACGTPAVAFSVGGIPEIVNHMETGYLAEYKDAADFIKGILYFIDDPEKLKKAGQKASLDIHENFSLQKMINEYLALYEELLGGTHGA